MENNILFSQPIPPFNQIKPEHFIPALKDAITKAEAKVEAIANDTAPATVENTLMPLDTLFEEIGDVRGILAVYYTAITTPEIDDAMEEADKLSSAFSKRVFQNPKLAARFKQVKVPADEDDTQQIHKQLSLDFEAEGSFLDEAGQKRLKKIDEDLITLASTFSKNVQASTQANALHVTDKSRFSGLTTSTVESFAAKAKQMGKEGWVVVPEKLLVEQLLESADDRDLRRDILHALDTVGSIAPYDNRQIVQQMLALRHERGTLLGYPHYAAYALKRTMAGNLDRAEKMLDTLSDTLLTLFEKNLATVTAFAKENGGPDRLEPYDTIYWGNRYKAATFGYDPSKLTEYLPLEKAIEGYFTNAEKLFGVTFKANPDYPVYHPDVVAYDIMKDGKASGILYMDNYTRDGKLGGAWVMFVRALSGDKPPLAALNLNQLKPEDGSPCLLSPEQVETLFHEGGHAVNDLIGNNTKFVSLRGAGPSSDFAEFHSMVLENWAIEAESLSSFARHHATGESPPAELLEAKKQAGRFFGEAILLRTIQNAKRDLLAHKTPPEDYPGDVELQRRADFNHPAAHALRTYPLARFTHMFDDALSKYASGYYGYVWSEVLAANGFAKFKQRGLYDATTAAAMTKLYSYGASRDTNKAFEEFNEGPIRPEALFEAMGVAIADAA